MRPTVSVNVRTAAPRTRRSTRLAVVHVDVLVGCSAHAEIDPWRSRVRPAPRRLLRARGDRPALYSALMDLAEAAPRTRRSTRPVQSPLRRALGCSAHAEIDPREAAQAARRSRLLRARGDRPLVTSGAVAGLTAAPRTRRSTPRD